MKRLILSVLVLVAFSVTSAVSATFYVATDGDNGNPGTLSEPWRTIQFAADTMSSGDTVFIKAGIYVEAVDVETSGLSFHGESGVVMEAPSPGTSQEAWDIKGGVSDILIRDFEAKGGYGETVFMRPGSSEIEIKACELHGNTIGILVSGADDVKILECDVHHNSNGISLVNGASLIRIRDTESHDNTDGLGCSGDADGVAAEDDVVDVQITDSKFYDNGEDGLDLQADRARVSRVEVYGNCRGVRFWNERSWMVNSLIYDNTNVGVTATMLFGPVNGKIELFNNTIDNPVRAFFSGADKVWRLNLINNIMTSTGKVVEVADCMTVKERYNIFDRSNAAADHYNIVEGCDSGASTVRYSGTDIEDGTYESETGEGDGTRAVDPEYVSPGSDYHLDSSSLGVDTGLGTGWSLIPNDDLDGASRPQGSGIDKGAYEQ